MGDEVKPPRLPADAPQDLKDFVAGKRSSVVLDTTRLAWLPAGDYGMAPTVVVEQGDSDRSATVRIGWDLFGIELPVSIEAGKLVVDTSSIPSIAGELRDGIDDWVRGLNDSLAGNGQQLDRIHVVGDDVTIGAVPTADATPPPRPLGGVQLPPDEAQAGEPEPAGEPEASGPEASSPRGCLLWALGLLVVVGVVGLVLIATRADDAAAPGVPATDAAPVTDATPVTDAAPATEPPPATEPTPATDAVPATDAAPPTGGPPPTDAVPATDAAPATGPGDANGGGPPSPLPDPFAGVFSDLDDLLGSPDLSGSPLVAQPDAAGDAFECASQSPSPNTAPDITGIVGTIDGSTANVAVAMNRSPLLSEEDFSFAVLLQTFTASNQRMSFQWEIHDTERTVGRVDESGEVDPDGADVMLTDAAVLFSVPTDTSDPIVAFFAQGFSTQVEGDVIACDDVVAAPVEDPVPPTGDPGGCTPDETIACVRNGRFAVTMTGPTGPATVSASSLDDAAGFRDEDVRAYVRVLDRCAFNDRFWVFAAATTNVEYTVTVTDLAAATPATHQARVDAASPAVVDTMAFSTCP